MKSLIKKITVAVCIAASSITFVTATVSATDQPRPLPGTQATETTKKSSGEQSASTEASTNTTQSMAQASVSTTANKKYLTNLGAFGWFALSVAVNFILSCWIGNKYYNLAVRSSQSSNEIRALRKDIEEKFASTLTDVEDRSVEVMNRNENYSRTDEGISMPEHRVHVEMNDEERETMRKWDKSRITQRVIAKEEAELNVEDDEEEAYEPRPSKREYQPTRRASGIDFEDDEYDDEDYDDYRENRFSHKSEKRQKSSIAKATNKAKDFLNNVFPFGEN